MFGIGITHILKVGLTLGDTVAVRITGGWDVKVPEIRNSLA